MLKIHEIREIIRLMDQSGITHLELELEGDRLLLKKEKEISPVVEKEREQPGLPIISEKSAGPTQLPKEENAFTPNPALVKKEEKPLETETEENFKKITSPMVGTFYAAPNPDAKPYVTVGDYVEPHTIVCIIEAMKLFNEIEADVRGQIVKVLVENGQLVEYGQPLFLVKAE
ncbi:MAG: acetyl-CoA carboxylase biotin carboxyl carrier protein [Thermicanus sp.]|nr:acetyl-CoA carboxylase biotin carboxyl carrier protein [Thermicanus sp.]